MIGSVLIVVSLFLLAAVDASDARAAELPERPNIIFIMADDLGYGDLGCFGQETVQTPELDQLAREGMRLTDFYAGCTVCRPSRLSLMTGRHMGHTPINSNARYVYEPADVTVAELLHEAGYATGGVGKWAMGGVGTPGHPNQNGFDFWFGYLDQSEAHNYYPELLWRNAEKVPLAGNVIGPQPRVAVERVTYSHDEMTREALDFIRRHAEQPFLLHAHWTIPHANNEGGRATGNGMEVPDYGIYADRNWPNTKKAFAAMVTRMDRDVGRLIGLLRELQLTERTLVIFTSDNGPHHEGGHVVESFDSNGPLRGAKRDLYEGGIREPTIAWWPGVIEPGSTSAEPLAFWDFLPTACALAGVRAPHEIDGVSFVNTLIGEPQESHDFLFWRFGQKTAARKGRWKAVQNGLRQPLELYDLLADLGEENDVAKEHSDVVAEMQQIMRQAEQ